MEDKTNNKPSKGCILIAEIMPERGVVVTGPTEFAVHCGKRTYHLQASNPDKVKEWTEHINEWVQYLSSYD